MSKLRQANIRKLIYTYSRRLQKLEEQQALHGARVSPEIFIEIEDIKEKIESLQTELEALESAEESTLQTTPPETSTPARILIVEDEKIWQEILQDCLAGTGYHIEIASSYSEARHKLQSEQFSLVTLDARLRQKTKIHEGILLLDYIYKRFFPTMPVIIISGEIDKRNLIKAFKKFSVTDVMLKEDFEYDEFLAVVNEALPEQ